MKPDCEPIIIATICEGQNSNASKQAGTIHPPVSPGWMYRVFACMAISWPALGVLVVVFQLLVVSIQREELVEPLSVSLFLLLLFAFTCALFLPGLLLLQFSLVSRAFGESIGRWIVGLIGAALTLLGLLPGSFILAMLLAHAFDTHLPYTHPKRRAERIAEREATLKEALARVEKAGIAHTRAHESSRDAVLYRTEYKYRQREAGWELRFALAELRRSWAKLSEQVSSDNLPSKVHADRQICKRVDYWMEYLDSCEELEKYRDRTLGSRAFIE